MKYNESDIELNLTKKTILKAQCSKCKAKNKLTLKNGGIVERDVKNYHGKESSGHSSLFKGEDKRLVFRVSTEFVLVCPNCGFEYTIGYRKTDKFIYSDWGKSSLADW